MRPDELSFLTNARQAPRFSKLGVSMSVSIRLEPDADEEPDKTQRCYKCLEVKSLDMFHKANHRNLGVSSECKECKKLRDRLAYAANPAKHIARCIKWQKANPEAFRRSKQRLPKGA